MSVRRVAAELGRALRETGAALDATGLRLLEKPIFKESFARHRPVSAIGGLSPTVPNDAFVAPSATVIGDVSMGPRSAVMYGAVVRGDLAPVSLGAGAVVGARAVLHAAKAVEGHVAPAVRVGAGAIVGPGAVLHACTVEAGASVGAGAHVGEGALVEEEAQVAPNSVVHPGRRIPARQLWAGNPAAFIRDLSKTELAEAAAHAEEEADVAADHAREFLPQSTVYLHAEKLGVEDASIKEINATQAAYEARK